MFLYHSAVWLLPLWMWLCVSSSLWVSPLMCCCSLLNISHWHMWSTELFIVIATYRPEHLMSCLLIFLCTCLWVVAEHSSRIVCIPRALSRPLYDGSLQGHCLKCDIYSSSLHMCGPCMLQVWPKLWPSEVKCPSVLKSTTLFLMRVAVQHLLLLTVIKYAKNDHTRNVSTESSCITLQLLGGFEYIW